MAGLAENQRVFGVLERDRVMDKLLAAGRRRAEDMWNQSGEIVKRYVNPDDRVLDVGIGFGQTTATFMNNLKGNFHGVFTLDVEPMLHMADLASGYILARGEALPYETNSFDTVFFFDVLHHTVDPRVLLTEAVRAVKMGGMVIIIENLLRDDLPQPWDRIYREALFTMDNHSHAQSNLIYPHTNHTLEGWREMGNGLGLKLVTSKQWQWGLVDFIPGMTGMGRDGFNILRPFTDGLMVFRNLKVKD